MTPPAGLSPEQAVWIGIMVLSAELLVIGAGFREEKTLRFLGAALFVLGLMLGCDIWVLIPALREGSVDKAWLDPWQLAFQALACAFLALLLRLQRRLAGTPGPRVEAVHRILLAAWAFLAVVDAWHPADLLTGLRGREWWTSAAYDFGFTPYLAGLMGWITWTALTRSRSAGHSEGRMLKHLGFGFALLWLGGTADLAAMMRPGLLPHASYSLIGALAFCLACIFILTDRIMVLYGERRKSLLEISRVHGELGAGEPLRALGSSAAQVSDAIRADVAELRDKVRSLGKGGGHAAEIARIERARDRLERLVGGILEYSRSGMPGGTVSADPAALAAGCLQGLAAEESARVRLACPAGLRRIPVEEDRIVRALGELVRNALEAGAGTVEIRARQGLGRTVFTVEDDGRGLEGASPADIPKPFFTTRRSEGGFGLGAAIAAGTARGHGGSLRYYRRAGRGLLACLALPESGAGPAEAERPVCALVSGDPGRMEDFLASCSNLGVTPYLLAGDGRSQGFRGPVIVDGRGPGARPLTEETLLALIAG